MVISFAIRIAILFRFFLSISLFASSTVFYLQWFLFPLRLLLFFISPKSPFPVLCALNDKCEFIWLLEATDLYFFFFLFFPLVIWWPYLYNTTDDCLWFVAKTVNKSLEHLRYIAHHPVCLQQTKSIILDEIHCFVILYLPQATIITRMVWFHQRPVKVYNCHRNEV